MSNEVESAPEGAEVAPVENEQEQASSQPTGEQVEAQQQEKPRDEKGRFVPQERVNEITKARREAERRAEALERELHHYRQQQPAQQSPQSDDKPPSPEDFDFDMGKWAQAAAEHAAKRAERLAEEKFRQQEFARRQHTLSEQFEQRAVKYAAEHPDFDDAVTAMSQSVRLQPEIVEAIAVSEHGPAVAHYLAQHLDDADRISRLPAHLAAVELGRIEGRLTAPKPKPVTSAPAPVPSLGGGSGVVRKDPDSMDMKEWLAWRESQLKK